MGSAIRNLGYILSNLVRNLSLAPMSCRHRCLLVVGLSPHVILCLWATWLLIPYPIITISTNVTNVVTCMWHPIAAGYWAVYHAMAHKESIPVFFQDGGSMTQEAIYWFSTGLRFLFSSAQSHAGRCVKIYAQEASFWFQWLYSIY